jgi:hypothetical protein
MITTRDGSDALDAPAGWDLLQQNGREFVFERRDATGQDMLVWMQLLERREVIRLEFTRIADRTG